MSRWIEVFENHPFQATWKEITALAETISVPEGATRPNIKELTRLKKVIKYLDELLIALDPELFPAAVWAAIEAQNPSILSDLNTFRTDNNFQNLVNANNRTDKILSSVTPYVKSGKGAAQAAGHAFKAYSDTINEYIDLLKAEAETTVSDFKDKTELINSSFDEIEASKASIKNLEHNLLFDDEKEISLQSKLKALETDAIEWHTNIRNYHQKLTSGTEEENAIARQIEEARLKSIAGANEVESAVTSTTNAQEKLTKFYEDVTGTTILGVNVGGGLQNDLVLRNTELDDFKDKQQIKYKTLVDQIESLIPGATSVGLATAYQNQKMSYNWPIVFSNTLFFLSVGALLFIGLTILFDFPFLPTLAPKMDVGIPLVSAFLNRLPITLPLVWLAYTASKRRSEYARLKQEYAHKEVLAKSYQSFKKQIDDLGENTGNSELLVKLLSKAIDTIGYNASATLDGKHGEKMPITEEASKAFNSANRLIPK